jgi:hypothetical protein
LATAQQIVQQDEERSVAPLISDFRQGVFTVLVPQGQSRPSKVR